MQTSSLRKHVLQVLVVIGIGLLVLYILYADIFQAGTDELITGSIVENSTSTDDSAFQVDSNGETPGTPNVSIPNLNRPIIFTDDIPEEARVIYRKKIEDLISMLTDDPSLFNIWVELGAVRKAIGDHEGAREIWEYASVISPENNVSFFNLGDLYHYYLKDYAKAEKNFLIAKDNNPLYIPVYRALFDLYILSYKQNTSAAEDILLEGLQNNPNNLDLTVLLAGYYKGKGDTTNARIYYEKALTEAERLGNASMVKLIKEELSAL